MSTIRPFLSSGVRLAVVPDNSPSDTQTEHGEALENADSSIELEGSCELMSEVKPDAENNDDETKRHNDEQRHKKVLKKWMEYLDILNRSDN